ncbi:thermoresistant gluconokinase [Variibacter gotjawalensis]|uniref:Gluconokinase n=1 Tax=Variibacter gotjawalensis TaxID=1333996 RepID=A0A0S3PUL4_9BRAD|nr:gluconokinase [Variibacter gotjawalensis]NIK49882.1 gluconokinase [Variibacter gotjawalensis]RZS45881.1 gluconate kinase (SKI family) [Variibacter gotjawalensis]BAT59556.1 thermoresistant gluconokinase [Variibacter gotjawalensis]
MSARKLAAIVVMGVSGAGKTTIAEALAEWLGYTCRDADEFHPPANIAKMSAGTPLTDDDRWPWLRAIAAAIDVAGKTGKPMVVTCSALKHAYRDVLLHGRDDVVFAYLAGSRELIASRLKQRKGHFMPPALLDSQFATLEEPRPDEPVITLDINHPVDQIVDTLVAKLQRER